jgi:stage II sporulation protein R
MVFNNKRILMRLQEASSIAHFLSAAAKFLLVVLIICIIYSGSIQGEIADHVVRLHIVANSDSAQDQALKLKVRDAILEHMHQKYPDGATREEAAQYLKNSLPEIKQIANEVLKENGSRETANVRYGVFSFPTKAYEGVTLPAGMYEAVRVELGEAQGQNWWCVMFPPLCVADAHSLRMDEDAMSELKDGLSEDAYSLITDVTDKSNVAIKVKFRIIEWVESSRIKLAEMISHLF